MTGTTIQSQPGTNQNRRGVSINWILLFSLLVWSSTWLPLPNPDPISRSTAKSSTLSKEQDRAKSGLQILAEIHGDLRSHEEILRGNELGDAVTERDRVRVRGLLRQGVDVNSRYVELCRYGYTPLMEASFLGDEQLVELLLVHRADVNLEREGRTAMHFAVAKSHEQVIRLLVASGARQDPKQLRLTLLVLRAACKGFVMRDGEGHPLFPGVYENHETAPTIDEALAQGADVNASDCRGFTPLMFAANLGLLENVMTLVAHGADSAIKAKDGSTALSLAERPDSSVNIAERKRVVQYLRALSDQE